MLTFFTALNAQTTDTKTAPTVCDSLEPNFDTGKLTLPGGILDVNSPVDSIIKYLKCVIKDDRQTHEGDCGGGLRLEKQGVYFNPDKGYIEFESTTTAKLPISLFGFSEEQLNDQIDGLSQVADIQSSSATQSTESVYQYPRSYGSLAVWVSIATKTVYKIQMHNKSVQEAVLCVE